MRRELPTVALGLGLMVAACGSKKPPTGRRDAGDAGAAAAAAALTDAATVDAAAPRAATDPSYRVIPVDAASGGRLTVTLAWPTASAAMRRSPGRTRCGSARSPRALIGALHGVAGAVITVEVAAGKEAPLAADVRLTVRDCAIVPRVLLAPGLGGAVEIQSQDEAPHRVVVTAIDRDAKVAKAGPQLAAAALPAMGHVVGVALASAGTLRLAADGADDDAAYVIAPAHPYVALTDEVGAAAFERVPPGTYSVRAWLPPSGGQPALATTGAAVVTAGGDATLTLTLTLTVNP